MHDAANDIPFENHTIDGIRRQTQDFLTLRQLEFRLLALGDITRIDDHPADERVVQRRHVTRLQPAIRAVLVPDAQFLREVIDLAGDQPIVLGPHFRIIRRVHVLEDGVPLPLLAGVSQRITHPTAHVLQPTLRVRHRDDVARMLGQGQQAPLQGSIDPRAHDPFRILGAQHRQTHDAVIVRQGHHADLEPAGRPIQVVMGHRIVAVRLPPQRLRVNVRAQRGHRHQGQHRATQHAARQVRAHAHGRPVGIGDVQIRVQDQKVKRQLVQGRGHARSRRFEGQHDHRMRSRGRLRMGRGLRARMRLARRRWQ